MKFGGMDFLSDVEAKPCAICTKKVPTADKVVADRRTIHKQCFKCGLCDSELKVGSCAMELTSYGPFWFCSHCALRPPGEKEAKIKNKKRK